ncbi:MAG TPA: flagellar basal body P-ring protein FlgI [Candidatus Latescibacteria bacterium]|nr:flagellar basal body P-ring protein FlgI [Candidatus Latescibacterota bacterium]
MSIRVYRKTQRFCLFGQLLFVTLATVIPNLADGAVRIKDIARIQGPGEVQLMGYGLVVGLNGTGDGKRTQFTVQSMVNLLKRMGISVDPQRVNIRNVAAVMVTARLSPFSKKGDKIDVTVSSMGDASNLEGGTLLLTPLASSDGTIYATAQGPVSVGGFTIEAGLFGEQTARNYTLVGRVPDGAIVELELPTTRKVPETLIITLFQADYTTAARIAEAVDEKFGQKLAKPLDASTVSVRLPEQVRDIGEVVNFIAQMETTLVVPDVVARVVINEKTGTIVVGENVTISPVAIAHGNLNIEIKARPLISQPPPFSKGKTVVVPEMEISVEPEKARVMVLEESASVGDVAKVLNALGATPRDIIAIFQALKQAGALRAKLVII